MKEVNVDHRYRARIGEISHWHGKTEVKMLRKVYGVNFALYFLPNASLSEILDMLDENSLMQLVSDHEAGTLEAKLNHPAEAKEREAKEGSSI
jgi:hypothetical protein